MNILIPYLHYIGIMVIMGALITEHLILKPGMSRENIKTLAGIDLIYGLAALLVLATGLLRWFLYGKGSDYYLANPFFHVKLTLFVIMGVISIFPTLRFLRWRKLINRGEVPVTDEKQVKRLLMLIRVELLILAALPLLAVLMARMM